VGIGGFIAIGRTGERLVIEPGTPLEETIEAMKGRFDSDSLSSLTDGAIDYVAKTRARRIETAYPLCTKHRDEADKILALLDPDDEFNTDNPEVAKALLDCTERALAEFLRLSAED
jgi:hypothetical protein